MPAATPCGPVLVVVDRIGPGDADTLAAMAHRAPVHVLALDPGAGDKAPPGVATVPFDRVAADIGWDQANAAAAAEVWQDGADSAAPDVREVLDAWRNFLASEINGQCYLGLVIREAMARVGAHRLVLKTRNTGLAARLGALAPAVQVAAWEEVTVP